MANTNLTYNELPIYPADSLEPDFWVIHSWPHAKWARSPEWHNIFYIENPVADLAYRQGIYSVPRGSFFAHSSVIEKLKNCGELINA